MPLIPTNTPINLNGSTRLMDATGLKTLKYQTGGPQAPQTTNPSPYSNTGQWYAGQNCYPWLTSGTSASYDPAWGCEPLDTQNCIHAFPNQDAINYFPIPIGLTGDLLYLDGNNNLVIQPSVLTSAELATVKLAANSSISGPAYPATPNAYMEANTRWLSAGFESLPMAMPAPCCIGARVQMPYPYITGMWAAIWLLNAAGSWPPEVDILECIQYSDTSPQLFYPTLHYGTSSANSQESPGGLTTINGVPINGQTFHDFWCVLYSDYTSIFYDGICVASYATPTGFAGVNWYMIVSYQIAGPNSGYPGPLDPSLTTIPPMTIADVVALQMPATYGSGTTIGYVAPNGPAPITFSGGGGGLTTNFSITSSPTSVVAGAAFTLAGLAGTQWVNVAAFDASGNKISGDDTPSGAAGNWTLSCSSSTLAVGNNTVTVDAFSTPAGVSGGTVTSVNVTIVVTSGGSSFSPNYPNPTRNCCFGSIENVTHTTGGVICNNIFYQSEDQFDVVTFVNAASGQTTTMLNNAYVTADGGNFSVEYGGNFYTSLAAWQAVAPGGETNAITANPTFNASGTSGIATWSPNSNGPGPNSWGPLAYVPGNHAAYIGTGLDITGSPYSQTVGTQDYFGNTIPNGTGTGYNIGAYGAGLTTNIFLNYNFPVYHFHNFKTDGLTPAEITALVIRSDKNTPITLKGVAKTDKVLSVGPKQAGRTDAILPMAEISGVSPISAITENDYIPIEVGSGVFRTDANLPIAKTISGKTDTNIAEGLSGLIKIDRTLPVSENSGVIINANSNLPIESQVMVQEDMKAPLATLGALLRDNIAPTLIKGNLINVDFNVPIEQYVTASTTMDMPIDTLSGVVALFSDNSIPLLLSGSIQGTVLTPAQTIGLLRGDAIIPVQLYAGALRDALLPLEILHPVQTDSSLPLTVKANLILVDSLTPFASLANASPLSNVPDAVLGVASDVFGIPIRELTGTGALFLSVPTNVLTVIGLDPKIFIEQLATTFPIITSYNLPIETGVYERPEITIIFSRKREEHTHHEPRITKTDDNP